MAETLADRIRTAAHPIGGLKALADKTGIPISSLNENLKGRKLSVERLIAIAEATDVPLDWLATGRGEPHWIPGRTADELRGAGRPRLAEPAPPPIAVPATPGRPIDWLTIVDCLMLIEDTIAAAPKPLGTNQRLAVMATALVHALTTTAGDDELRRYTDEVCKRMAAPASDGPPG